MNIFAEHGFHGEQRILDASAYDIPQSRRRVVFAFGPVGFRWPHATGSVKRLLVATTHTARSKAILMQQVPRRFKLPDGEAASKFVGNGVRSAWRPLSGTHVLRL